MAKDGSEKDGSTRKTKVKSGCRTCKIRKVKCDEQRPSCHRCVSTGRTCEGYGIWDKKPMGPLGCLSAAAVAVPATSAVTVPPAGGPVRKLPPRPPLPIGADASDGQLFDWFRLRVTEKLTGIFHSEFWGNIVFPALASEPAIFHAVLALTSAHKHRSLPTNPQAQEQLTLRQYSKAIYRLGPHFAAGDAASLRIALVTCIIFVNLEFLRGHFHTGNQHLINGMHILESRAVLPDGLKHAAGRRSSPISHGYYADEWLAECMIWSNISAVFMGHGALPKTVMGLDHVPTRFDSLKQARRVLQQLIMETLHSRANVKTRDQSNAIYDQMSILQDNLKVWLTSFDDFEEREKARTGGGLNRVGGLLLRQYHTMTSIEASVCVHFDDEGIYDDHTDDFIKVMTSMIEISRIILHIMATTQAAKSRAFLDHPFIADMGGQPCQYYVATKCRIPHLRMQAAKLMEQVHNTQGMWDSHLMAAVAKEAIKMEQSDVYSGFGLDDDYLLHACANEQDLAMAKPPTSKRLHKIVPILSDDQTKEVLVQFMRLTNGTREVLVKEYDVGAKTWSVVDMFYEDLSGSLRPSSTTSSAGQSPPQVV